MSCTELYGFDKNGNAYYYGEIDNAWRGAMMVWRYFEDKYLELYIPDYIKCTNWYKPDMTREEIIQRNGFIPTRLTAGKPSDVEEIWNLVGNKNIPMSERIVLATTFDKILVAKNDMPAVITAFESFEADNTSLKEQAEILKSMLADDDCIAVGWNQTDINAQTWDNKNPDPNDDTNRLPYNCLTQNEHTWLSDLWKEPEKGE